MKLFIKIFLLVILALAIAFFLLLDKMSYKSISESEFAAIPFDTLQPIKVCEKGHEVTLFDSKETRKLKVGEKVTILGVYKENLRRGRSPLEYAPDQQYLILLADGAYGCGILEEAVIGLYTMLPNGDSAKIKTVKVQKDKPTISTTNSQSDYNYIYTVEGSKKKIAYEDLNIKCTQRLVGKGEKPDYYLFPRYQNWNEFNIVGNRTFSTIVAIIGLLGMFFAVAMIPRSRYNRKGEWIGTTTDDVGCLTQLLIFFVGVIMFVFAGYLRGWI